MRGGRHGLRLHETHDRAHRAGDARTGPLVRLGGSAVGIPSPCLSPSRSSILAAHVHLWVAVQQQAEARTPLAGRARLMRALLRAWAWTYAFAAMSCAANVSRPSADSRPLVKDAGVIDARRADGGAQNPSSSKPADRDLIPPAPILEPLLTIPNISPAEARQLLARGRQRLHDGDLSAICDDINENFLSNQDRFAVGGMYAPYPEWLHDGLYELLYVCEGLSERGVFDIEELRMRASHERGALAAVAKLGLALRLCRSAQPEDRREARKLLEVLARAKKMLRAEGYAALARLRTEAGDVLGAEAALRLCRAATRRQGLCPTAGPR